MSTLIKLLQSLVMNAVTRTSSRISLSEKSPDYSLDSEKPHISLYPSSPVQSADTSTKPSNLKKVKHWIKYSGLQGEIYDTEEPQ